MKKDDESSPSIILAGRALLVKMLITLEPRYAFGSNYEYFFFLFLFMPPPFVECGRALSVAHVCPCVCQSVHPSVHPFVHHLSGYFVSATHPTILSQSF